MILVKAALSNVSKFVKTAVVTEQSLPTPEDPGSNPAISNFNKSICSLSTAGKIEKRPI